MTEENNPNWTSVRSGEAVVSFGEPYYGKRRIIANAPLALNSFDDLIDALIKARFAYKDEMDEH